jgi:hypothetical protein
MGMGDKPGEASLVETWFGEAFHRLSPDIQALHRLGGRLEGDVIIQHGKGLSGVIGRRLSQRLGLPAKEGSAHMVVSIFSASDGLHWDRQFNDGTTFRSLFLPRGHFPHGHWIEASGRVQLTLQVDILGGGWHWVHKKSSLWGWTIPAWLQPKTAACKVFRDGYYHFEVKLLWGSRLLVSYGGALKATLHH